jgi:hypothetical protein
MKYQLNVKGTSEEKLVDGKQRGVIATVPGN